MVIANRNSPVNCFGFQAKEEYGNTVSSCSQVTPQAAKPAGIKGHCDQSAGFIVIGLAIQFTFYPYKKPLEHHCKNGSRSTTYSPPVLTDRHEDKEHPVRQEKYFTSKNLS